MNEADRDLFDELLQEVLEELPKGVIDLLDEVPLIVLDEPDEPLLRSLGLAPEYWAQERRTLCGLHSGRSVLEQSVEVSGELPEQVHVFRRGVVHAAGGWGDIDRVADEIHITVLHEIGHHFGLDEDDLEKLGYA